MKKLFYLLVCLLCFSCQSTDFSEDATKITLEQYNTAFVKVFGTPDAKQTWGFSNRSVTRACYPNSNMWESDGYVIPADITQDEITKVYNAFNEVGEAEYESLVNWDCFFVQHVYGAHSNMDWLYAWDPEGHEETIYGDPANNWQPYNTTVYEDHIFNFNATLGSIQLMVESSTQKFGFHSSQDSKKHPTFRMMQIDGAYYVGFDYYANGENSNQQEARDFIYTDWIVKICPGRGITPPANELRIIAEDLSATDNTDFDFNDVVLDVNIEGTTANCTLIAAGGTLPLRINNDNNLEVHKLFGVDTNVMVNTGAGPTKDYIPFTLNNISNAADIKLEVFKNGSWIELTAQQGTPAAKIAVFQNFKYCKEREPITTKYPNFRNWVQNINYIWW